MRYFKRLHFLILILVAILSLPAKAQETLLPDTTLVCMADSVMLDAGTGFLSYFWWNTGQLTQTIWVKNSGLYKVSCDTMLSASPIVDSTKVFFQRAKIEQGDTIETCYGHLYPVTLSVDVDTLKYLWTCSDPNYIIENDTAIQIKVVPEMDTTTFYVAISDSSDIIKCIDSIKVFLFPRITFDKVYQTELTCPPVDSCTAKIQVLLSGGFPPYKYSLGGAWQFLPSFDLLCEQTYTLTVKDSKCSRDTLIEIKAYEKPEIQITFDPETVYIKNPVVTFSFTDNPDISDWKWNFGDTTYSTLKNPTKVFEHDGNYTVWLTYKINYITGDFCNDSVKIEVNVKPVELSIPNIFTPNGDGFNQVFEIKELENYMSNEIVIFNRYGKKVFSQTNYQSDWDGDNLKEGVYFYVLKAKGYFGTETRRGSITLLRH